MKRKNAIKKVMILAVILTFCFSMSAFAAENDGEQKYEEQSVQPRYSESCYQYFEINNIYVGTEWGQDIYTTLSGYVDMDYSYDEGSSAYIHSAPELKELSIGRGTASQDDSSRIGAQCYDCDVVIHNNSGDYVLTITIRISVDTYGDVYISRV